MNRLTHGCRSERTVLPFEDPAEWEFTLQSWTSAYNPEAHRPSGGRCARLDEDPTAATLVFETARAHWIFQRNQQRLDETESGLPPDALEWTEYHIKRYNNFSRYKTTAERSFYRAFNNLEAFYKRQADKAAAAEKARAQMAKIHIQWLKKKAEAAASNLCALQWVRVVANQQGECITAYGPTNEQLVARAADSGQPPEFVTRIISFVNGVPPAYEWAYPNDIQRYEQTIGMQQFTYSGWLQQIEAEKVAGTGHVAPYDTALLTE